MNTTKRGAEGVGLTVKTEKKIGRRTYYMEQHGSHRLVEKKVQMTHLT